MVSAIDLGRDDLIHIGTSGLKRLGKRLADVVSGQPSPDLLSVAFEEGYSKLRVTYKNVHGSLRAPGLPTGYSFRSAGGSEIATIYKTRLEGDSVVLYLESGEHLPGSFLYYGWGLNPYVNITDEADAAVPAFGPIKV
jgi:sialate O-acetylesterase